MAGPRRETEDDFPDSSIQEVVMRLAILRGMFRGQACGSECRAVSRTIRRRSLSPRFSLEEVERRLLPAITIALDYSLDSSGFFSSQTRRDVLQSAADAMTAALNDSLAAITPNSGAGDTWTADFPNPATGTMTSVSNLIVPANTLIIYVGGGSLAGVSEAGEGSTGGFSGSGDENWLNTVSARGKAGALATPPTSFGPWGGSIRFDDSGGTNWYFGQSLSGLTSNRTDFLSVAEHEIGHVLGIGTSGAWDQLVSGGSFHGAAAQAVNGGQPVPVTGSGDHWAQGVLSNGKPALMDPVLMNGTRSLVTSLDIAGLQDIGWRVVNTLPPATVSFSASSDSVSDWGGSLVVTVSRTGNPAAFSVNYATSDGTALAGTDYLSTSGTLAFASGELVKTITIPILNDNLAESDQTLNLSLSAPTNGVVLGATSTALVTILDSGVSVPAKPPGDFDADGRTDLAVFNPSTAAWTIRQSTAGVLTPVPSFGATGLHDIPVVGDFDGVGHAEIAVFRPSTAQWFVMGPSGGHLLGSFGATNLFDIPVPGDYDGTGHTEMAVFRPSTGQWFVMGPTGGHLLGSFGATNLFDIPAPGDYDGTGHTEMAVFRPSTGQWFVMGPTGGHLLGSFGATNLFDIPVPGDYDGTGHTEMAVFRPSTGQWFVMGPGGGYLAGTLGQINDAEVPVEASVGSLVRLGITGVGTISASGVPSSMAFSSSPLASTAAPAPAPAPALAPAPASFSSALKNTSRKAVTADLWITALEQLTEHKARFSERGE